MDAAGRKLRAQIAADTRWARQDPKKGTEPARQGFHNKFMREALSDAQRNGETIDDAEVRRRAKKLLDAHMKRLALSKKRKAQSGKSA